MVHTVPEGKSAFGALILSLESLKWLADIMAFYKMNQLQLYVEHTYLVFLLQQLLPVSFFHLFGYRQYNHTFLLLA